MKHISSTTSVSYRLTEAGSSGWFSQQGYSQYYKRLTLQDKGLLPQGEEVYGYAQVLEHIEELRKSEHNGVLHYADMLFHVEVIGTMVTRILPNEGIPTKRTPVSETDRFYQDCKVTMFDMEMQKYLRGQVRQISTTGILVHWSDNEPNRLSRYEAVGEDIKNIRVL